MPDLPWRDANVTEACARCQRPLPAGRARQFCSPRCRQAAYRARHRPPRPPLPTPAAGRSRTASGVYECPDCGDRLAGERRCPDCNLYARRLDDGGCCTACGEIITVAELLDLP